MGEDRTQPHLVTKKVKGSSEALVAQGLEHAIADRRVDRSNRSQSYIFLYISPPPLHGSTGIIFIMWCGRKWHNTVLNVEKG